MRRATCPTFVYANADEVGYYRVRVTQADLAALLPFVSRLPERERFGVVSNAWAAVRAEQLPASAVPRAAACGSSNDPVAWSGARCWTRCGVRSRAGHRSGAAGVRALRAQAVRPHGAAPRLAIGGDPVRRRALHARGDPARLGDLGEDGPHAAGGAARAHAPGSIRQRESTRDLARIALPLAAKRGDAALFDRLRAVVEAPAHARGPRDRRSGALAAFDDPALIKRTLGLVLDGTIRAQDLRYLFPAFGLRRAGRDVVARLDRDVTSTSSRACFRRTSWVASSARVPALCDAGRVRAAEAFLARASRSWKGSRRTCASRWKRGCAAPRSPTRAREAVAAGSAVGYDRIVGWRAVLAGWRGSRRSRCTPGATRSRTLAVRAIDRGCLRRCRNAACSRGTKRSVGTAFCAAAGIRAAARRIAGGYHVLAVHAIDCSPQLLLRCRQRRRW